MIAKFYIPWSYELDWVNRILIEDINKYPQFYKDNFKIVGTYGAPNCLWNGGRIKRTKTMLSYMEDIINYYHKKNLKFRFTFTNSELNDDELKNEYCLKLAELSDGFIVADDKLKNILSNKYKEKEIVSSVSKIILNKDLINKELKNNSITVLHHSFNKDFSFLEDIKNKNKIELLVNSHCVSNCPHSIDHYKLVSKIQKELWYDNGENYEIITKDYGETICSYNCKFGKKIWCHNILPDDIDRYLNLGFYNFKIEGRELSIESLIDTYICYFAKQEYRNEIIDHFSKWLNVEII